MSNFKTANPFELQQLEPRILLSADGLAGAALVDEGAFQDADSTVIQERATEETDAKIHSEMDFETAPEDIFGDLDEGLVEADEAPENEVDSDPVKADSETESEPLSEDADPVSDSTEDTEAADLAPTPFRPSEGDPAGFRAGATSTISTSSDGASGVSSVEIPGGAAGNDVVDPFPNQLTETLNAANGPPAQGADSNASSPNVTSPDHEENATLASSSAASSAADLLDEITSILDDVENGESITKTVEPGDVTLGGIFTISDVELVFDVERDGDYSGSVSITSSSLNLDLGASVSASVSGTDAVDPALDATYTLDNISDPAAGDFALTFGQVDFAIADVVTAEASGFSLSWNSENGLATSDDVDVTNVHAELAAGDKMIVAVNGSGLLQISDDGVAAVIDAEIETNSDFDDISFNGSVQVKINTTGSAVSEIADETVELPEGPYVRIALDGDLLVYGSKLSGEELFFEMDADDTVTVGGTNLSFELNAGSGEDAPRIVGLSNGSFEFTFDTDGFYGAIANADVEGPDFSDQFELSGTVEMKINTTGSEKTVMLTVPDPEDEENTIEKPMTLADGGAEDLFLMVSVTAAVLRIGGSRFTADELRFEKNGARVSLSGDEVKFSLKAGTDDEAPQVVGIEDAGFEFVFSDDGFYGAMRNATVSGPDFGGDLFELEGTVELRLNTTEVEQEVFEGDDPLTLSAAGGAGDPYIYVGVTDATLTIAGSALEADELSFEKDGDAITVTGENLSFSVRAGTGEDAKRIVGMQDADFHFVFDADGFYGAIRGAEILGPELDGLTFQGSISLDINTTGEERGFELGGDDVTLPDGNGSDSPLYLRVEIGAVDDTPAGLAFDGIFELTTEEVVLEVNGDEISLTIADMTLTVGDAENPVLEMGGSLDLLITSTRIEISHASLEFEGDFTLGSFFSVSDPAFTLSDFVYVHSGADPPDLGLQSGEIGISASSAELFSGQPFSAAATGIDGSFDLVSYAFSIELESFTLEGGDAFTAEASGIFIGYDPEEEGSQTLVSIDEGSITFGMFDLSGDLEGLEIRTDGFKFDELTVQGSATLGSILTFEDFGITIKDFAVDYNSGLELTGSIEVFAGKAELFPENSAFTAELEDVSATFNFDDDGALESFVFEVGNLDMSIGGFLVVTAEDFALDTGADAEQGEYLVQFGAIGASIAISESLTISGEARNFAITPDGDFVTLADFGVSFDIDANDTGSFGLPDWLPSFDVEATLDWPDFSNSPHEFTMVLSASVDGLSLPGLDSFQLSGSIEGLVIDVGMLVDGEFPILAVDGVSLGIEGELGPVAFSGGLAFGLIRLDSEGERIDSGDTETTVDESYLYGAVDAGIEVANYGLDLRFAISEAGPLSFFVSASFPLLLEPNSGLMLTGVSGGINFGLEIDEPEKAEDLAGSQYGPTGGMSFNEWVDQLEGQVIELANAGGERDLGFLEAPMRFELGASISSMHIAGAIEGQVDVMMDTEGKFVIGGTVNFYNQLDANARIYGNLSDLPNVELMFHARVPTDPELVTIFGEITIGFYNQDGDPLQFDSDAESLVDELDEAGDDHEAAAEEDLLGEGDSLMVKIDVAGGVEVNLLEAASARLEGTASLTITSEVVTLDTEATLTITPDLGQVGSAAGRFVLDLSDDGPHAWGVLKVSANLEALEEYGIQAEGDGLARFNTTGTVKTETIGLPDEGGELVYEEFEIDPGFKISIEGEVAFSAEDEQVFHVDGSAAFSITDEGIEAYLNGTMVLGPEGEPIFSFDMLGVLLIDFGDEAEDKAGGIAAMFELSFQTPEGEETIPVAIDATLFLQFNTMEREVNYSIPDELSPLHEGTEDETRNITISAGAPQVDGSEGDPGVYFVIMGEGQLILQEEFVLDGDFRIEVTPERLEVDLRMTIVMDPMGTLEANGQITITTAGVVAGLQLGVSGGEEPEELGEGDLAFEALFQLEINTTTEEAEITRLKVDPETKEVIPDETEEVQIAAGSVTVFAAGEVEVAGAFTFKGSFYLRYADEELQIEFDAATDLEVEGSEIFSATAEGVVNVSNDGIFAVLVMTMTADDEDKGYSFEVDEMRFEVNTTAEPESVTLPSGSPTTLPVDHVLFRIEGTMTIGEVEMGGDFMFSRTGDEVEIEANASLDFGVEDQSIFTFSVGGSVAISEDGLAGIFTLGLDGDFSDDLGVDFDLAFQLEVNTTGETQSLTFQGEEIDFEDPETFLRVAGTGTVTIGPVTMEGRFVFEKSDEGLEVAADATFDFAVEDQVIFEFKVGGAVSIDEAGLAGVFTLELDGDLPDDLGVDFDLGFQLEVNTTGETRTIDFGEDPIEFDDPSLLIRVGGTGSLTVGSIVLDGSFKFALRDDGAEIAIDATFELKAGDSTLVELEAAGELRLFNDGVAGILSLSVVVENDDFGFTLDADFQLELNTTDRTGSDVTFTGFTVDDANGSVTGGQQIEVTQLLRIVAGGTLSLADSFEFSGRFEFVIDPNQNMLGLEIDARIAFFDINIDFSGAAEIHGGSDAGIAFKFTLGTGEQSFGFEDIFSIKANLEIEVNTRGTETLGIAKDTYRISINNLELDLFTVVTFEGSGYVEYSDSIFTLAIENLRIDFFGIAEIRADGWFNSVGDFEFNANGSLTLGTSGFGISGDISFHVKFIDGTVETLSGSIGGSARIFGISLGSVDVGFGYDNGSGKIGASLSVTINLLVTEITKTANFNVGFLKVPPPVYLAGTADNPQIGPSNFSGGELHLNMGERASERNLDSNESDEFFAVEQIDGDGDTATVRIMGMGRVQVYEGVTKLYADAGDGDDYIEIDESVQIGVDVNAGSGQNQLLIHSTGQATITGSPGDDLIETGAGDYTINTKGGANLLNLGSGAASVTGGSGDDSIYWTAGGPAPTLITGGGGTNSLTITLTNNDEEVGISTPNSGAVEISFSGDNSPSTTLSAEQIQTLAVDGRAGSDRFDIYSLAGSGIEELILNAGEHVEQKGTTTVEDGEMEREIPNFVHSFDAGAANEFHFHGTSAADEFVVSTSGDEVRIAADDTSVQLLDVDRDRNSSDTSGDSMAIYGYGGSDRIDASGMRADLVALRLEGGAGDDLLIGSPFDDTIDLGSGSNVVTGGAGTDTFIRNNGSSSDVNILIEHLPLAIGDDPETKIDRAKFQDVALFNDYLITGTLLGDDGGEFNRTAIGSGVIDPTADEEEHDYYLQDRADRFDSGAEVETLLDGNGTPIFEQAILTAGDGNNIMVVGSRNDAIRVGEDEPFSVQDWSGSVELDNGANTVNTNNDYYIVHLKGENGARINILDTGGTSGFDELFLYGTDQPDNIRLVSGDKSRDLTAGRIVMGEMGELNRDEVHHIQVDRVTIQSSGGDDTIHSDNTSVLSVIRTGSGNDSVTVGTVPQIPDPGNRTLEFPEGVPVADTENMTDGNSAPLVIYGNSGNDVFEVNHNKARLYLHGGAGDDTFIINTFLVLKENADNPDEVTNLNMLFGGSGDNRYEYLQNAPVHIDGGPGTNTMVINGTPIADVFVVTDNFIAGAGRINYYENIQRIEVNAAGGADEIYVLSVPEEVEVIVRGGSGDDEIHMGGQAPTMLFDPPEVTYQPPSYEVQDPPYIEEELKSWTRSFSFELNTWDYFFNPNLVSDFVDSYVALLETTYNLSPNHRVQNVSADTRVEQKYGSNHWWLFNPKTAINLTVTLDYVEETLVTPEPRTVTPPAVTVDPPPFAFEVEGSYDLSDIKGRVIIDGGTSYENLGDSLTVHHTDGSNNNGSLQERTVPVLDPVDFDIYHHQGSDIYVLQDADSDGERSETFVNPDGSTFQQAIYGAAPAGAEATGETERLFQQVYLTEDGEPVAQTESRFTLSGLGLPEGVGSDGLQFNGIEIKAISDLDIRLGDADADFTIHDTHQENTRLVLGGGQNTVDVEGISGPTDILSGAGDAIITVHDANVLSSIDGRLTIDGNGHVFENVYGVPTDGFEDVLANSPEIFINTAPTEMFVDSAGVKTHYAEQEKAPLVFEQDGIVWTWVADLDEDGRLIEDLVQERDEDGNLLWLDPDGNETTDAVTGEIANSPSLIPVTRLQQAPLERTEDLTVSLPDGGTTWLNVVNSGTSENVSGEMDRYERPVWKFDDAGRPVFHQPGDQRYYFGGEPVRDPQTGEPLYYEEATPMRDLITGEPILDADGNPVMHEAGDPKLHLAGDPVYHVKGDPVRYYGDEQVHMEPVKEAFARNGLSSGDQVTLSHDIQADDAVWVLVYQEGEQTVSRLDSADVTVDHGSNTVTLDPSSALVGGLVVEVFVAEPVFNPDGPFLYAGGQQEMHYRGEPVVDADGNQLFHEQGDLKRYSGNEAVQIGDPVGVGPDGQLLRDENGDVLLYTAETITDESGDPVFHERGALVYESDGDGEYAAATYEGGERMFYLGNEAREYFGGEQAYYSNNDQVREHASFERISMDGMNGLIDYTGIDGVELTLGGGANEFTISATHQGDTILNTGSGHDTVNVHSVSGPTVIHTGAGADTVNVGSWMPARPGDLAGIAAQLTIDGGAGGSTMNVDATRDTQARTGTLTSSTLSGLGMGGAIGYSNLAEVNIALGAGNDLLSIHSTHNGTTNIDAGGGDDTIRVGSSQPSSGGTLNHVAGGLSIDGASGANELYVDDSGDTTSRTGILTDTTLDGLGMGGGIDYLNFSHLDLNLGSGDDVFTIESSHAGTTELKANGGSDAIRIQAISGVTTVSGGLGDDTIRVGSTAPNSNGTINEIDAHLFVNGDAGENSLIVDDTADPAATEGELTATNLQGLGLSPDGITYAGMSELEISLGSGNSDFIIAGTHGGNTRLHAGPGNDLVNVRATSGVTTIYGGSGNDTINVGTQAPAAGGSLNNIGAHLVIDGSDGSNVLNVDDTADNFANQGTLRATTLTGLGLSAAGITYEAIAELNINLGSGDDTFVIESTHDRTTNLYAGAGDDQLAIQTVAGPTHVKGGSGDDTLRVGSNAPADNGTVNGIDALLSIDGGAGSNELYVDDTGDASATTGTLTESTIRGLGMSDGIDYDNVSRLAIDLGVGDNTFTIHSTHIGETRLDSGPGDDTIDLDSIAGESWILGNDGDDTITVNPGKITGENPIGAVLHLDGNDGSDFYTINLTGAESSLINVLDTGAPGDSDELTLNGTPGDDTFLLRKDFIVLLQYNEDGEQLETYERVNYDQNINAMLTINAVGGQNHFAIDDNSSMTTINGSGDLEPGAPGDTYQIGQLFGAEFAGEGEGAGLGFGDGDLLETTRGWLTPGVTNPLTINGGDGDNIFTVYHNRAVLNLLGGGGDDTFLVRSFALAGSSEGEEVYDDNRDMTNVASGGGNDHIEYAMNAPVGIDGGGGFNTVIAVGTEFGDKIVVTEDGIYGSGLFVEFVNIQELVVHGAEGTDNIFVLGTPEGVSTRVVGGLGSDTVNIGGDPGVVVSNDLRGYSGMIGHLIETGNPDRDTSYDHATIPEIPVNIADDDATGVVLTESDGRTMVYEGGEIPGFLAGYDTYSIVLTHAPVAPVTMTLSAQRPSPSAQDRGEDTVLVSTTGDEGTFGASATIEFTEENWDQPQTVFVKAANDEAAEGERTHIISHTLNSADDAFNNMAVRNVSVTVFDDDAPGIILLPENDEPIVSEAGATDTYAILLTRKPTAEVEVELLPDSQLGVSSQKLTFTPENWDEPQVVTIHAVDDNEPEGLHRGNIEHRLSSADSSFAEVDADRLTVSVLDNDTPGVHIVETGGSTDVIEGGSAEQGTPFSDTYSIVLTSQPTGPVTINLESLPTVTSEFPADAQARLEFSVNQLTFTPENWDQAQTVGVTAIQDEVINGGDYKVFASNFRVTDIRGPLFIDGGIGDGIPPLEVGIGLPGETTGPLPVVNNPNLLVDEDDQVDRIIVHNNHSLANDEGTLTPERLYGLGMVEEMTIAGKTFPAGLEYTELEEVIVHLGSGDNHFTVEGTHEGRTVIHGGRGDNTFDIRSIDGHTTVYGGEGDDTFNIGSLAPATGGTVNEIKGLLTLDGGAGDDVVNVDDRGEIADTVGTLTQTSLTGLEMNSALEAVNEMLQLTVQATGGTFKLGYDGAEVEIAWDADHHELTAALWELLGNRNGVAQAVGDAYLINFQGELRGQQGSLTVDTTDLENESGDALVELSRRIDGINYYGAEMLNIAQGSGDDVFNIQGTLAATNLATRGGDDRIYVSSKAALAQDTTTDFLRGDLDKIAGALNIDAGTGENLLMISDEANPVASGTSDDPVRITDQTSDLFAAQLAALEADVFAPFIGLPDPEIIVDGLAPAPINYRADANGDFAGGISLWSGFGNDNIHVDGSHYREGVRTTTMLNTGLGDDHATLDLHQEEDGFFVLNTEGPYPAHDDLAVPDWAANHSDDDSVDASTSTLPLIMFGGAGDDAFVGGQGGDVIFGDRGRVHYIDEDGEIVAALGGGGPGDFTDGVIRPASAVFSVDYETGGHDTVVGGAGDDVIVGGIGSDHLNSGEGDNLVLADNGELNYQDGSSWLASVRSIYLRPGADTFIQGGDDVIESSSGDDIVLGGLGDDAIAIAGGDNMVLGDEGGVTFQSGSALLDRVESRYLDGAGESALTGAEAAVGHDAISTGDGDDVILGGLGDDTIVSTDGHNVVLGDEGFVQYQDQVISGGMSLLAELKTHFLNAADEFVQGGSDKIYLGASDESTGDGNDLVLAGLGDDEIFIGGGNNYVLGDEGGIAVQLGTAFVTRILTTAPEAGGADLIETGTGDDLVIGGTGADTVAIAGGMNIVFGDNAEANFADGKPVGLAATNPTLGGDDTIITGDGNDIILGGKGADWIETPAGNNLVFGDHGFVQANENHFVDAGLLPLAMPVESKPFTFTSIFTGLDDGGGDDIVLSGEGEDIILGGQGSDTIFGGAGDDDIIGGHNVAGGATAGSIIDGGSGDNVIAGDNAMIERRGDTLSPIMRALEGTTLYDRFDPANPESFDPTFPPAVTEDWQPHPHGVEGRNIVLLDHHADETADWMFGNDLIAGGPGHDTIFGQMGDDVIHGDGWIEVLDYAAREVVLRPSAAPATDGDDYIEGNGGNDLILGGLGQDDLVGGSSNLFGLEDPRERPNGSNMIFGGNAVSLWRFENDHYWEGNLPETAPEAIELIYEVPEDAIHAIDREHTGPDADDPGFADRHARDADVILGDNGNIFRIVGTHGQDSGGFLHFNYDQFDETRGELRIVPRGFELLDYVPGAGDPSDDLIHGGGDILYGEDGDDIIHGMSVNNVIYGGAGDDDIYGGSGHAWISGGAGQDGIIGDDGKIFTSRNSSAYGEPLHGIDPTPASDLNKVISTPGNHLQELIHVEGEIKKSVDLEPFDIGGNDIIYGGRGASFLHGGSGDDAISGAEALALSAAVVDGHVFIFEFDDPHGLRGNMDHALIAEFGALDYGRNQENHFNLFDPENPMRKVMVNPASGQIEFGANPNALEFLLNFDAFVKNQDREAVLNDSGDRILIDHGDDTIFGGDGHDWLVAGTGSNHLYGGRGDNLLNANNNLDTNGGLNDEPDDPTYAFGDIAYGGGGRDILIANTGADRLIDWAGSFNTYLVPFSPYGMPTVIRSASPAIVDFLVELAESDGADQTRVGDLGDGRYGDPERNGEPYGELGLVTQQDDEWQEQTGGPDTSHPGNNGGSRDTTGGFEDEVSGDDDGSSSAETLESTSEEDPSDSETAPEYESTGSTEMDSQSEEETSTEDSADTDPSSPSSDVDEEDDGQDALTYTGEENVDSDAEAETESNEAQSPDGSADRASGEDDDDSNPKKGHSSDKGNSAHANGNNGNRNNGNGKANGKGKK